MYPHFFFSNYKATEPHSCFPAGRPTSSQCGPVFCWQVWETVSIVFRVLQWFFLQQNVSQSQCPASGAQGRRTSMFRPVSLSSCSVLFLRQQLCLLPPRILSNWSLPTIPGSKVLSRTTMSEHCWNIAHQRVWERDINLELNVE